MSLTKMTMHRVKKILAWILALIILALMGAGMLYVTGAV